MRLPDGGDAISFGFQKKCFTLGHTSEAMGKRSPAIEKRGSVQAALKVKNISRRTPRKHLVHPATRRFLAQAVPLLHERTTPPLVFFIVPVPKQKR